MRRQAGRFLLPDPAVSALILHEQEVERMIVLLRSLVLYPSPLPEEMKAGGHSCSC